VFKGRFRGTDVAVKRLLTTNTSQQAMQEFEFECAIMAYDSIPPSHNNTTSISKFIHNITTYESSSKSIENLIHFFAQKYFVFIFSCRGLRHPNIVLFMGNCFVPETKEVLLVMELMERGSLHDIIHNPKVCDSPLRFKFILTYLLDSYFP
jgi:serine/threonine protein kinase